MESLFLIPFLPFTSIFGFVPISAPFLGTVLLITLMYVAATELAKRRFYRTNDRSNARRASREYSHSLVNNSQPLR